MSTLSPTPPDCGGGTLVLQLRFPDCWDGVNLDSADHKSHMAYTVSGVCPSNYPVPVPLLEFNVRYQTSGQRGGSAWPPARRTRTTLTASTPGTRPALAGFIDSCLHANNGRAAPSANVFVAGSPLRFDVHRASTGGRVGVGRRGLGRGRDRRAAVSGRQA